MEAGENLVFLEIRPVKYLRIRKEIYLGSRLFGLSQNGEESVIKFEYGNPLFVMIVMDLSVP